MIAISDLQPGRPLTEPLVLTATTVERNPAPSRRASVLLQDDDGSEIELIDYDGAELSVSWDPGERYRISDCSVKRGGSQTTLYLSPSKRTTVEALESTSRTTRLLVIGDTHVGRTRHPKTGEKIDPIEPFATAVSAGIRRSVDVVVHVGDLFHETASSSDAELVNSRVLEPLDSAGVPFYYLNGNHTATAGQSLLEHHDNATLLEAGGVTVGPDVRLYGLSHYPMGRIAWQRINFNRFPSGSCSILFLHQTLEQLSGEGAQSVDLDEFSSHNAPRFDLVLSGHHHDSMEERWNGIPVVYTGAAERMSTNPGATDRVAWFVTFEDRSLTYDRVPIP